MLGLASRCCASSASFLLRGARGAPSPLQDLLQLRGGAVAAAAEARKWQATHQREIEGGVTLRPSAGGGGGTGHSGGFRSEKKRVLLGPDGRAGLNPGYIIAI